jgi:hypothetical protein
VVTCALVAIVAVAVQVRDILALLGILVADATHARVLRHASPLGVHAATKESVAVLDGTWTQTSTSRGDCSIYKHGFKMTTSCKPERDYIRPS